MKIEAVSVCVGYADFLVRTDRPSDLGVDQKRQTCITNLVKRKAKVAFVDPGEAINA